MKIAKTIWDQITALTPQPVLWSWGLGRTSLKAIGENTVDGIGENYLGGLCFYVRGHKHKGHVFISLALNDTYTVSIGHLRKAKFNVKKQIKEVYFEELGSTIDEMIEKQPNYAY